MTYGCIGQTLKHSFSKEIHEALANYSYELKELSPEEVPSFMEAHAFNAINVTIPYKQAVMPFLDEISPQASAIGAVNTIVCKGDKLYGYNTDFFGLRALILRQKVALSGKKVLILGSGGTARTAKAVAEDLGAAEILIVSRGGKEGISYEEAKTAHSDAAFIINTTPCGMYPHLHEAPLDLNDYQALEGLVDAVYNPLRTRLVQQAQKRGIPAEGGLYMLVAQAAYAVEFFLDCKIHKKRIDAVFSSLCRQKENVILSGMPGSGKSTVGRLLSKKLCKPFYDTDQLITEKTGKTPAEWINQEGEAAFRNIESRIIAEEIAPVTGAVIATGGGAILRQENVDCLKMNGRIFFLDRPLEALGATSDRPLSSDREKLKARFHERYGRYCQTADIRIANNTSAQVCAEKIIKELKK